MSMNSFHARSTKRKAADPEKETVVAAKMLRQPDGLERVDTLLVKQGLAPSRKIAQDLIDQGRVFLVSADQQEGVVTKSSQRLSEQAILRVDPA
ncbi:MAG TPA: S4 domain-containing protein [Rhodocyclaceae bacterium]|jgi:ribosomal 50S subunit-recycling heat shock protein